MNLSDCKMIRSNRISVWFASIEQAQREGWSLVLVQYEPGWFINTYRAIMRRIPEVEIQFKVGPVKEKA